MSEILRIFVSATNDLEAERAIIGRSVAEIPVKIGIEIHRSPALNPTYDEIFEKLANVDRVYFMMGNDITAPAGLEWHLAWRLERDVLPLRRSLKPTPAALEFFHLTRQRWVEFRTPSELARMVTLDLARILRHPINRYGLTVVELERLAAHVKRIEGKIVSSEDEPGGAGGGGVLLDAGRREPLSGVALTD